MTPIRIVVFDLDDTLYLEKDYVKSGFASVGAYVERNCGISGFGEQCQELFDSGVRGNTFNEALERMKIDLMGIKIQDLVTEYRTHTPQISLESPVILMLNELRKKFPLGLLTGGEPTAQVKKIESLGIESNFNHLVLTGSWGSEYDKPNSKGWSDLQQRSGFAGKEVLYIADNPLKDYPASREFGWKFIRVRKPGSLHFKIPTPAGIAEIDDVSLTSQLLNQRYQL